MAGLHVQLDVDYADDEQFIEAGPLAELLYIRGMCFIKRKMTDGKIKRAQLSIVGRGIPNATKHAAALVEVGRWRATNDGWAVPAYLKRNPSKAEVEAGQELAREAGIRGNHERWHVGPEGKPSPKCPLCRRDWIGSPDRGANPDPNRGPSPESESTTQTEAETESSSSGRPIPDPTAAAKRRQDDDEFARTVTLVTDARCEGRQIKNMRAYRFTVARELEQLDGDRIRDLLSQGRSVEDVATEVTTNPQPATRLSIVKTIAWCGPDCSTCAGDAWIDTGAGMAPCPERIKDAAA